MKYFKETLTYYYTMTIFPHTIYYFNHKLGYYFCEYYYIHSNYDVPYKVKIIYTKQKISNRNKYIRHNKHKDYAAKYIKIYDNDDKTLVKRFDNFRKIFIGKSPLNKMTKFSSGYGPTFNGNSILIDLGTNINNDNDNDNDIVNNYCYIGDSIEYFSVVGNRLVKFVSPVGNNDVPYPYAIDASGAYYLFSENVVVQEVPQKYRNYPYEYYYEVSPIVPYNSSDQTVISNFGNIEEFYSGDEKFSLRYAPNASKEYDRLTSCYGQLIIVDTNKVKRILDKERFIKLNDMFGEMMGFSRLIK
jgi:hypothetical protein